MPRESKYTGVVGDLHRLSGTMEANKEELPQMEPYRAKLGVILTQAMDVLQQQAELKVRKQEMSKEIRRLLTEGQRVATLVRIAVKEHYGIREEKVAEFGVQPFRGRKTKRAQEKPAPDTPPPAGSATPVT